MSKGSSPAPRTASRASSPLAARSVETSRGREAVYAAIAPDAEVVASGTAMLVGGRARVEFDRLFAEAIDGAADIRVTATPTR